MYDTCFRYLICQYKIRENYCGKASRTIILFDLKVPVKLVLWERKSILLKKGVQSLSNDVWYKWFLNRADFHCKPSPVLCRISKNSRLFITYIEPYFWISIRTDQSCKQTALIYCSRVHRYSRILQMAQIDRSFIINILNKVDRSFAFHQCCVTSVVFPYDRKTENRYPF